MKNFIYFLWLGCNGDSNGKGRDLTLLILNYVGEWILLKVTN